MSWTAPVTRATGYLVLAADWNNEHVNDLLFLIGPDGASPPGAFTLWDSTDAGVTFPAASIATPSLSQNYKHLLVVYSAVESDASGSTDGLQIRCNGDAGANYATQYIIGAGSSVSSNCSYAATSADAGAVTTNGAALPAGRGAGMTLIPGYAGTSEYKKLLSYSVTIYNANSSSMHVELDGSVYLETAAITSLTFLTSSGSSLLAGRFTLYGMS